MEDNAFLDKSVLIGFCFPIDTQHKVCRNYIEATDRVLYISEEIESVYDRRFDEFVKRHRRAVSKHVRALTKQVKKGELTEEDLEDIKDHLIPSDSPAKRYLTDHYDALIESGETVTGDGLRDELRSITRSYESLVRDRKTEFDSIVEMYERERDYSRLDSALEPLRNQDSEDYDVILDAHALANNTTGSTVFVTNNPKEFASSNHGRLVKEQTDIWDIDIPVVTSD